MLDAGAVAGGDLAHDGEAQAAAGARRARHAVEALEHALALRAAGCPGRRPRPRRRRGRCAAPVRTVTRPPRVRILDRVVHQVGERLAQQEGVALAPAPRSSSKPRSTSRASAWCTQASASPSTTLFRSTCARLAARAGLGAREREQLVGEARGADRRLVHLLELRAARPRAAAARARARCAPAGRRAACAAGARRWRGSAAGCGSPSATSLEQAVQRRRPAAASPPARAAASIGRRSRGERALISSDRRASGRRPRFTPNQTMTSVASGDQQLAAAGSAEQDLARQARRA